MPTERREDCVSVSGENSEESTRTVILNPSEKLMKLVKGAQLSARQGEPFLPVLDLIRNSQPGTNPANWWYAYTVVAAGEKKVTLGWYGNKGNVNDLSAGFVLDRSQGDDTPGVHILELSRFNRSGNKIAQSRPSLFFGNVPCTDQDEVVSISGGKNFPYQKEDFYGLLQTPIIRQIRIMLLDVFQRQESGTLRGLQIENRGGNEELTLSRNFPRAVSGGIKLSA